MQLEALVGVALGEVGETLGEQRSIEEGDGDAVVGLYLCALVIDVGDRTTHTITLNPVAYPQAPAHELDAVNTGVDDVLEGNTDTG